MSDHKVILSPRSKERALYMLEQNKLEFYVSRTASKHDIRGAIRSLFQVEVSKVNTEDYQGRQTGNRQTRGRSFRRRFEQSVRNIVIIWESE